MVTNFHYGNVWYSNHSNQMAVMLICHIYANHDYHGNTRLNMVTMVTRGIVTMLAMVTYVLTKDQGY